MDELVDILDENGNYTGKVELKSKAHLLGLFHPTINVWCYTESGKVLLQQRGKNKDTFPLKWDVSVAGHIGAGESAELGALREMEEEIGVSATQNDLEKIGTLKKEVKHSESLFDREFCHVFLCQLNEHVTLKKQDSEVEALKWITLDEFKPWISSKHQGLIPNSEERFSKAISAIETRISKN